ncbi:MAG: TlpA family protein disulfide reductase [Magnetovibrio sp.]|nr:TlpA family protein disulfide reductase [Magnetovibrio sp.]
MPIRYVIAAVILSLTVGGLGMVMFQSASLQRMLSDPGVQSVDTAGEGLDGFSLLTNGPMVPNVQILDEAGNPNTLQRFRGKVVLLNLWATWCPPCIKEMPDLNALQIDYADRDFVVVPVASGKQGRQTPAAFLRDRGLMALTTFYDPQSKFLRIFDIDTLPTTFLIDKTGRMRGGVLGLTDWHSDDAKALIDSLLNEPVL